MSVISGLFLFKIGKRAQISVKLSDINSCESAIFSEQRDGRVDRQASRRTFATFRSEYENAKHRVIVNFLYRERRLCKSNFLHYCILEYKPRILCSKSTSNMLAFSRFRSRDIDAFIAVLSFNFPVYTAVLRELRQNFTNKTSRKYERTVSEFG